MNIYTMLYLSNKKSFSGIFLIIVFLSIFSMPNYQLELKNSQFEEISIKPKTSVSWLNTSISIDAQALFNTTHSGNWNWAVNQPWCSGNGTILNPYTIENIRFTATSLNSCLLIQNSSVSFKIINCKFTNATTNFAGIDIRNSSNGVIDLNNISTNFIGINLHKKCVNINMTNNEIGNNTYGILAFGIYFNGMVTIEEQVSACYIKSNNFTINDHAIFLNGSITYVWITDNTISNSTITGVILKGSSVPILFFTINIEPQYNFIYENEFRNNIIHASDEGIANHWNSSTTGNFWDNYTGTDLDDNGIGDAPYTFGTKNDYLPIFSDEPNNLPVITTTLDEYLYQKSDQIINISWNITDPDTLTTSYSILRNNSVVKIGNWVSNTLVSFNFNGNYESINNISMIVNDGCTQSNVSKDVILKINDNPKFSSKPSTTLPYAVGRISETLDWVISDNLTLSKNYALLKNGTSIKDGNWNNGLPISYNISSLAIGVYNFTIKISDGYGGTNENTAIVTVIEDISNSTNTSSTISTNSTSGTTNQTTTQGSSGGDNISFGSLFVFISLLSLGVVLIIKQRKIKFN
jgi:Periplasmic copper-binding protein (NosD)